MNGREWGSGVCPADQGVSLLVDARGLYVSGIGRYLREIIAHLVVDPRFRRILLLGRPEEAHRFLAGEPSVSHVGVVAYPFGFYSAFAQLDWLRIRRAVDAHVFFFPHYAVPFLLPARSVVAVQDLTHFKVPAAFAAWRRALAAPLLRRAVHGSSRVLVSSRSTYADLVERIPSAGDKTQVIPLGVGRGFTDPGGEPSVVGRLAVGGPYLLCVGNRKPHKNLAAAVEALARARTQWPELQLVVVGRAFGGRDGIAERARRLGVADAVVEQSEVADRELRALYLGCEALLFPSLYEGFGLPPLEAMASGVPVIASDRASIPEVVGDAGILLDPDDHAAMAAAVLRLRDDPRLRADLIRKGRERASRFSWTRTARRTADVLFEVACGRAAPLLAAPRESLGA